MKKQFLFLAVAIVAVASYAQTSHTVSNNPSNPAQFTEIQEAINAASDGDTIYVAGSSTTYSGFNLNKSIYLIGEGYSNSGSNANTIIQNINLSTTENDGGASGSTITGFYITGDLIGDDTEVISNINITRNRFNNVNLVSGTAQNWIIRRNLFFLGTGSGSDSRDVNFSSGDDIQVINNFFQAKRTTNGNFSGSDIISNSASFIFSNNIIFEDTDVVISNGVIANNIFQPSSFAVGFMLDQVSNCSVNNNITTNSGLSFPISNDLNNNLIGVNPQFTIQNDLDFDFSDDFQLQNGSPGKNAGTDGTDIGVFGGNFPFVFEPANPEISQLLINTVQVPVGGELEFTIQAEGRQ